ncbi:3-hydroxyacyl-CoA dehydrogenase NAD-binding domain-containing protein, partial [Paenibacillus sp. CCS19]|uniref:3-hydroxyacyl-CoA dehydrogenase NAD-binding domain-containing protein n=1 Tax=Paenibacillus sp. CCS19 TaxID=3158387 RepID=UPI00295EB306
MDFHNVTVAGSGVLGSQIAYQSAFKGFKVTVYDINDEALDKAKDRIAKLKQRYQEDLGASRQDVDAAYERLSFNSYYERNRLPELQHLRLLLGIMA